MSRTAQDARRWMRQGTDLLLGAAARLDATALDEPTGLPGWTRRHLVAHVAANADALGNLVHWAATGEETPMYASPEERAAGIERGAALPAAVLLGRLRDSATRLENAIAALTPGQWDREVVTAQGRTVPATEIPWLRAREAYVHAVDLDTGVDFVDLPDDFLAALRDDIRAGRGLAELPAEVAGAPLADVTAWLAGRPHPLSAAPDLGPWL
ncbi:maleylpyruvate isomerase N-terminal domain-containing protein [Streptomyces sp. NPDC001410]|uniref:maleylpyruvate isomerase N-terminal domain-containing protein n=1 Tax=Streptomyces sp. NPDC001410 TaxID=3364574 RepID=UPI0036A0B45B